MTPNTITLTETTEKDLAILFTFQLDEEANQLAAFTPKDPTDKAAYIAKYTRHLADLTIHSRTIRVQDVIVGSIAKFVLDGHAELTYWIDKRYWGQGIATAALNEFLAIEPSRPIRARTAFDNYGSQHVLEKCGFIKTGTDRGFANARQAEVEEFIYSRLAWASLSSLARSFTRLCLSNWLALPKRRWLLQYHPVFGETIRQEYAISTVNTLSIKRHSIYLCIYSQ